MRRSFDAGLVSAPMVAAGGFPPTYQPAAPREPAPVGKTGRRMRRTTGS